MQLHRKLVLPLQVFEILTVKIWENKAGFPWDVPILLAVHSTANLQLDVLAVTLARIGEPWTAVPILGAIALILLLRIHAQLLQVSKSAQLKQTV